MNDGITALQILLGLFFFASGGSKIAGVKPMVDNFDHWQLPQWFRPIVGYVEIIGALGLLVGLLVRWVAPLAALWLCAVMLGALATHARIRDTPQHFTAPVLFLCLAAIVAVLRWTSLTGHLS